MLNIYYIDDDRDDRELFEIAVNKLGHSLKLFADSPELMKALEEESTLPDIIFIDYNLGPNNGCDVIEEIRLNKRYEDIPLVIYSTANHHLTVSKCRDCGAKLYIIKPASIELMLKAISYTLETNWSIDLPEEYFVYQVSNV
jgi:CheY-like chemotaxis protein